MTNLLQGVRIGAQRPSAHSAPPGRVSSSGQEVVELAASAGLYLDDWQQWVLDQALSEKADGLWCAFEVGLIVPRQNGKNGILEALELAAIYLFGERLVIHTAHLFPTATEHFLRMKELIENTPDLNKKVASFAVANGKEAINFRMPKIISTSKGISGSSKTYPARLKFVARSKAGARGFTGDRVIFDEAYDLAASAIGAMMPTMSTRPHAQIWYTSSAPMATSEVLLSVRERGLKPAEGERLFFAEWSCSPDCDPRDVNNWYQANPALGVRISEEYVRDEFNAMSRSMMQEFARERLGIPDATDVLTDVVFPISTWDSLIEPYESVGSVACAFDMAPDGSKASITSCERDEDGIAHIDVITNREGTGWCLKALEAVSDEADAPIRIAKNSPAVALKDEIEDAGIWVEWVNGTEAMQAGAALVDAVVNRRVRHLGNTSMRDAVVGAVKRDAGDLWSWGRRDSTCDISPLTSASLALAGAMAMAAPMFAAT